MRGRFYSPAWHRFLNSNQGIDPILINQFAYTLGSPLMLMDPTGMDNCPDTDGRSPASRANGGVGHDGDMTGASGGDPGHYSQDEGTLAALKSVNDDENKKHNLGWRIAHAFGFHQTDLDKQIKSLQAEVDAYRQTAWKELARYYLNKYGTAMYAFAAINRLRDFDPKNIVVKDAEHYLFARASVAADGASMTTMGIMDTYSVGYMGYKSVTYNIGIEATPPSVTEMKAGFRGVEDGYADRLSPNRVSP